MSYTEYTSVVVGYLANAHFVILSQLSMLVFVGSAYVCVCVFVNIQRRVLSNSEIGEKAQEKHAKSNLW